MNNDLLVNKRLKNKTIWSLEDIIALDVKARGMWEAAYRRAQLKCDDPALLVTLAEVKGVLADIRIQATVARSGEQVTERLEAIATLAIEALPAWETAHARAKLKCDDPALLRALAEIKSALADVRLLANVAQHGEYAGRRCVAIEEV